MTTTAEPVVDPMVAPPWRRKRFMLRALAIIVVLAITGAGIGYDRYAHDYHPLAPGNGPFGSVTYKTLKTLTDGISTPDLALTGSVGVDDYTLYNDGGRAVKILGFDPAQRPPWVQLRWASASNDSANEIGTASDGRPLPVTIGPHSEIVLQFVVHKPSCGHQGVIESLLRSPIRWSATGVTHTWVLQTDADDFPPVAVCFPRSARHYVAHNR